MLNTSKRNISSVCIVKTNPTKVYTKTTFNNLDNWKMCNAFKRGATINQIKDIDLPQQKQNFQGKSQKM